jgi:hypothetical protein
MKKGFATIQVVIVLSALTLLLLVVLEASAVYAAGSIAEDLCAVTGSSLLSEYNVALQKRYGVFAMSANRARLQAVGRFYLESGLQAAPMLVKLSLGSLSFRTEDWEAGDPSVFGPQIARLGAMALGRDLLTSEDLGGLRGGQGSLLSGDLSVDLSVFGELTASTPDD